MSLNFSSRKKKSLHKHITPPMMSLDESVSVVQDTVLNIPNAQLEKKTSTETVVSPHVEVKTNDNINDEDLLLSTGQNQQYKTQYSSSNQDYQKNRRLLNPELLIHYPRHSRPRPLPYRQYSTADSKYSPQPFIPERFVRANYRLFISPSTDIKQIKAWLSNSNHIVDWCAVQRVDVLCVSTSENLQCPICLEDFLTAPRITHCGHIYCYPCIVQCFKETQTIPRCPVCGDSTSIDHLKPVRFQLVNDLKTGSRVTLCLIRRLPTQISHCVVGIDNETTLFKKDNINGKHLQYSELQQIGLTFSNESTVHFQRLAGLSYTDTSLQDDILSLECLQAHNLNIYHDTAHSIYIHLCLRLIRDSIKKKTFLQPSFYSVIPMDLTPKQCHELFNFTIYHTKDHLPSLQSSISNCQHTHDFNESNTSETLSHSLHPLLMKQIISKELSSSSQQNDLIKYFYFYQLQDGQFCFLNELCFQCLIDDAILKLTHNAATFKQHHLMTIQSLLSIQTNAHSFEISKNVKNDLSACDSNPLLKISDSPNSYLDVDNLLNLFTHSTLFGYFLPYIETILPHYLSHVLITWIDTFQVNYEFRKLRPWLKHLPLSSTVSFIEIDLSSVVSSVIWEKYSIKFKEQRQSRDIERRRRQRIEKKYITKQHTRQTAYIDTMSSNNGIPIDPMTGLTLSTLLSDKAEFPSLYQQTMPTSINNNSQETNKSTLNHFTACIEFSKNNNQHIHHSTVSDRWVDKVQLLCETTHNQKEINEFPDLNESTYSSCHQKYNMIRNPTISSNIQSWNPFNTSCQTIPPLHEINTKKISDSLKDSTTTIPSHNIAIETINQHQRNTRPKKKKEIKISLTSRSDYNNPFKQ